MSRFLRLIARLKDYKAYVYLSILCNILMVVFTVVSIPLIIPFFQILFEREPPAKVAPADASILDQGKNIFIDLLNTYDKETALIYVCLGIAICFFLKNLFRYLARYFLTPIRNGIVRDLRKELFSKYLSLPVDYFSEERKGSLITKLTADVMEVEMSILQFIQAIFKDPLLIIGSIGFMLYVHPGLTVFVFFLMIFSGILISTISRRLKQQSKAVQESLSDLTSTADEAITGMSVIKAFNVQDIWKANFGAFNERYRSIMNRLLWRRDLSSPLAEFFGVGVVIIVLYYGSHLVFNDAITPEVFFAFIFAFYNVIEPSKSLSNTYYNVQKGMAAVDRIDDVLLLPNEDDDKDYPIKRLDQFKESIEFRDVYFKYPGEEKMTIASMNLVIKKGEKIALVGASGSGKSTVLKLLLKFHLPSKGQILLDGNDIEDISNFTLRGLIGWVTQEAFLYNASVKENIIFGREEITPKSVAEAVEMAQASTFISTSPGGLEASVGERGNKFSGGEKQRLSIARSLAGNPSILLLDEPTSALDPKAEHNVTRALQEAMKGRTSIIIAHRMSTIINADRIIVMDEGKIVGVGSHAELLKTNRIYQQYVTLQNSNAERT